MEDFKSRLQNLVKPAIESEGYELVDIHIKGSKSSRVLRFFIGSPDGVTINACAFLSRKLSDILDFQEEPMDFGSYRLEVSSPGIERPLQTETDFRRKIGKDVSILYRNGPESSRVEGVITEIKDGFITIKAQSSEISIELSSIEEAKLRLPF